MDELLVDAGLPDWLDEMAYAYTLRLTRRAWAWEFMRRNPDFQRNLADILGQARYAEPRPGQIQIELPAAASILARRWGLLFR